MSIWKRGDRVAVGNIVDSCGECANCRAGFENYCVRYPTPTYLGTDRHDGRPQQGAYSSEYVVTECRRRSTDSPATTCATGSCST